MKRLVTLMIAILAMVAILFGVKNIIQNKEAKEELKWFMKHLIPMMRWRLN